MKRVSLIAAGATTGLLVMSSVGGTALAWHPQGKITKSVQNVTTNSALADANTASSAVAAKPGDILNYVIVVSNVANPADKQYNDMDFTKLTDTLPAGVELVATPAQRQINEDLGLIKPGAKVTKTYQVKVTATKDGVIENKACFTGDSTVKDNKQAGCDTAVVKVTVPPTPITPPVTPTTPVTPEKPATPTTPAAPVAQPTELPHTGAGSNAFLAAGLASILGYVWSYKRRATR